jgi:hypothetical protein
MTSDPTLVGHWRKASSDAAAQRYPDHLEFRADGTYRGRASAPGTFVVWDVGSYRVQGETLRMSTATDAIVAYRLSAIADRLGIVDERGVEISYAREA